MTVAVAVSSASSRSPAQQQCHALSCLAARGRPLHRADDLQAERREADVRRRAAPFVGHRAAVRHARDHADPAGATIAFGSSGLNGALSEWRHLDAATSVASGGRCPDSDRPAGIAGTITSAGWPPAAALLECHEPDRRAGARLDDLLDNEHIAARTPTLIRAGVSWAGSRERAARERPRVR